MKKLYILIAIVSVTTLVSCNKNNDLDINGSGIEGDNQSAVSGNIQIRIESVDNDGSLDYSPVTSVNF